MARETLNTEKQNIMDKLEIGVSATIASAWNTAVGDFYTDSKQSRALKRADDKQLYQNAKYDEKFKALALRAGNIFATVIKAFFLEKQDAPAPATDDPSSAAAASSSTQGVFDDAPVSFPSSELEDEGFERDPRKRPRPTDVPQAPEAVQELERKLEQTNALLAEKLKEESESALRAVAAERQVAEMTDRLQAEQEKVEASQQALSQAQQALDAKDEEVKNAQVRAQDIERRLSELRTASGNVESLEAQLDALTTTIVAKERERASLAETVRQATQTNQQLTAQFNDLQAQVGREEQKLAEVNRQVVEAQTQLQTLRAEAAKLEGVLSRAGLQNGLADLKDRMDNIEKAQWLVDQIAKAAQENRTDLAEAFTKLLQATLVRQVLEGDIPSMQDDDDVSKNSLLGVVRRLQQKLQTIESAQPSTSDSTEPNVLQALQEKVDKMEKSIAGIVSQEDFQKYKDTVRKDFDNLSEGMDKKMAEALKPYAKTSDIPSSSEGVTGVSEETVKRLVDEYLKTKREEVEKLSQADNDDGVPMPGTAVFGKPDNRRNWPRLAPSSPWPPVPLKLPTRNWPNRPRRPRTMRRKSLN